MVSNMIHISNEWRVKLHRNGIWSCTFACVAKEELACLIHYLDARDWMQKFKVTNEKGWSSRKFREYLCIQWNPCCASNYFKERLDMLEIQHVTGILHVSWFFISFICRRWVLFVLAFSKKLFVTICIKHRWLKFMHQAYQ